MTTLYLIIIGFCYGGEQKTNKLVFLVSFSQRRRQQRRAKIVRLDGIKRARENPRAKILAASSQKTVVTTSTGSSTKRIPEKLDALDAHLVDHAWDPSKRTV